MQTIGTGGIRKRLLSGFYPCRAFTVIELLVVVLILSVMMAIALPVYMGAVADSQIITCRANMQTIANAERSQKLRSGKHSYSTVAAGGMTQSWVTANLPDLKPLVLCPTGGSYSVMISNGTNTSKGAIVPSGHLIIGCTKDGTFAPGIDAQ